MAQPRKVSEIPAGTWAFVGVIGAVVAAKVAIVAVEESRRPRRAPAPREWRGPVRGWGKRPA